MSKFVKPNIDRTIYLFSDKAIKTNVSTKTTEYRWNIPDLTLNDWGKLSLVSRVYKTVGVTATPITTRVLNISCKDTIDTSGFYGDILDISAWNYLSPFYPLPPITVSPQTINSISLAIDDDMAVKNGGILTTAVFCIVLKLTEGDVDRVEFGSTNNVNVNQRQLPYY